MYNMTLVESYLTSGKINFRPFPPETSHLVRAAIHITKGITYTEHRRAKVIIMKIKEPGKSFCEGLSRHLRTRILDLTEELQLTQRLNDTTPCTFANAANANEVAKFVSNTT